MTQPTSSDTKASSNDNYCARYWKSEKALAGRKRPDSAVIEAFARNKLRILEQQGIFEPGNRILDVAAGDGYFSYYFEKRNPTVALDISLRMIRENPIRNRCVADIQQIPFGDESFDVVFCSSALPYVDSPEQSVREMARVAATTVVILQANPLNPLLFVYSLIRRVERKQLLFTRRRLVDLLVDSGLRIVHSATLDMLPPNRTPEWLVGPLSRIASVPTLGLYNLLITRKPTS